MKMRLCGMVSHYQNKHVSQYAGDETWKPFKRTQIIDTMVEMLHREIDMSVYNLTRLREDGTNQVRVPLLIV